MILKIVFSISIVIFLNFAVTSYSGYENELFGVNTVLKSVMEYPLPEIIDVSFSSFPFISRTSAGYLLISMMWFILGRKTGKATETEHEEIIAQNKRLKEKIVEMEKEVSEHREKRLIAEKKLRELEMSIDKKREKENKEMLKQLKSAIKEEIAALKCKHKVTEHLEERLPCEKRISELETSMDKKREKENGEMLRQVKSAIKEEVTTLKCEGLREEEKVTQRKKTMEPKKRRKGFREKKNSDAAEELLPQCIFSFKPSFERMAQS